MINYFIDDKVNYCKAVRISKTYLNKHFRDNFINKNDIVKYYGKLTFYKQKHLDYYEECKEDYKKWLDGKLQINECYDSSKVIFVQMKFQ